MRLGGNHRYTNSGVAMARRRVDVQRCTSEWCDMKLEGLGENGWMDGETYLSDL